MRRAAVSFAVVFLAGVVALAAVGLSRGSDLAYSFGALVSAPVVELGPGKDACQGPLRLPSGQTFDRVAFTLGTYERTGAPVDVVVRETESGRQLAAGHLPGGYADIAQAPRHVVRVDRVATDAPIEICLVNEGSFPVAVYGQPDFVSPHTTASLDGKPAGADMAITLHTEKRSLLALLPDMAERAARFRAGWVTPAVYAVLGLLLLVGAPLLLARGLARAAAEDG